VALADGEHADAVVYAGALLCLVAIVLVSSAGPGDGRPAAGTGPVRGREEGAGRFHLHAVGYGLAGGTCFGLFFLFLRNAGQSGALWPVAAARLTGMVIVLVAAAATLTRPVLLDAGRRLLFATAGSGLLDALANVCYVAATRAGLLGLAIVLTSLYPGITVLLARLTLGERLRIGQRAGLLLAGIGIVLVTV
jgi:drug/metabolite transporter (DMT)-like permease